MKKLFLITILTASLAACGGKKAANTMPGNTGGSAMEQNGATGGAGYGGAGYGAKPPAPAPGAGASADPCAGGE